MYVFLLSTKNIHLSTHVSSYQQSISYYLLKCALITDLTVYKYKRNMFLVEKRIIKEKIKRREHLRNLYTLMKTSGKYTSADNNFLGKGSDIGTNYENK